MSAKSNVIFLHDRTNLTYTLLPGQCPEPFEALSLHNEAFSFWAESWEQTFKEISGEKLSREDFFRQNAIGVLQDKGRVIGLHLYTFFNLESLAARAVPYFHSYSEADLERLREMEIHAVMSMEYFTIAQDYRKHESGIQFAAVLSGLGYELLRESGYQSMIAPCRQDRKVDQLARMFGAESLSEPFQLHGVPVINMMTKTEKLQTFPNEREADLIAQLWQSKTDLTGLLPNKNQKTNLQLKKSA